MTATELALAGPLRVKNRVSQKTFLARIPLRGRRRAVWQGGLIVLFVFLAYLPALRGQFIWDDDNYVTHNALLHSLKGLWQIWMEPGATPQYYPLAFTSFWVDYHLWGLNPLGYHLTNVLLQALNAILLWAVLRRLQVPGAWLAAALFAVHPVNVESVAWITERKNVLAGFFFLSSALACLEFWLPEPEPLAEGVAGRSSITGGLGRWRWYGLALLFYVCALLAKTATVGLPAVIWLMVWWRRGKVGWRGMSRLVPFLGVGVVLGLMTVWVERHFVHAVGSEWAFSLPARCVIAGRVLWFYLGKLIWPNPLMFVYPRWDIAAAQPQAYLPVVAWVVVLLILWLNRKGWGRPVLVGLVYFVVMLFPVLGFFNVYYFRYSFVADHFQYLAGIGPLTLVGAGMRRWLGRFQEWGTALSGALLGVLGVLTWLQCGTFTNMETLWRTTLARNPNTFMAHNNLGLLLDDEGHIDEAMEHYRAAIRINPNAYEALDNLGVALAASGQPDEAIEDYRKAIQINPNFFEALNNLGNALLAKGQRDEAIENYYKALQIKPDFFEALNNLGNAFAGERRFDEAIGCYRQALQIKPDSSDALNNLGNALMARGRLGEAIENYHKAIQINPNFSEALDNLGNALAAEGRWDEAIGNYRQALRVNPSYSDALNNLGNALAAEGRLGEAIENFRKAIQVNSNRPETFYSWGMALEQLGRSREAVDQYREALRLNPNLTGALNNLAWVLATSPDDHLRNGVEAVRLAERACELTQYGQPLFIGTLATAYAEAGRFPEAVAAAEKAEQLAATAGSERLARKIRELLELYRAGKPYREPVSIRQGMRPALQV